MLRWNQTMKLRKAWVALAAGVMLLAASASSAVAATPPQLSVTTLDGKTFKLSAERGKWVIVNFWATWCSPCIAEMPAISKFVATHRDVTAIGLAWDRTPRAEIVKFVQKHPVDYPLAQVDPDNPHIPFAVPRGLPTTYLVAPDGQVARHFIGPVTARLLTQAIAAARAKTASPPPPQAK